MINTTHNLMIAFCAVAAAAVTAYADTISSVEKLERVYRLKVRTVFTPSSLTTSRVLRYKMARRADVRAYTPILLKEMSLYTPAVIKKLKLRQIVLCSKLVNDGKPAAGLASITDDTIVIDVSMAADSPDYMRRAFHHEIMHLIDGRVNGTTKLDAKWTACNPKGFNYFGRRSHHNPTSALTPKVPGFLTRYCTTHSGEDKAVLFSYLVADEKGRLPARCSTDAILSRKVKLLVTQLEAFSPDLGSAFRRRAASRYIESALEKKQLARLRKMDTMTLLATDRYGHTHFHYAAMAGHRNAARYLIKKGAEIAPKGRQKGTPLLYAALHDRLHVMRLLIDRGAPLNVPLNRVRRSPRAVSMLRFFMRKKDPKRGRMSQATFEQFVDFVPLIDEARRVDKNRMERIEKFKAAQNNRKLVTQPLRNGRTELMQAAKAGKLDEVKRLVAAGAAVNKADNLGATALHLAAYYGELQVIEYLLAHGAKVRKDRLGHTPADMAKGKNAEAIVKILRKAAPKKKARR